VRPDGALVDTPAPGIYLYPGHVETVVHGLGQALTTLLGTDLQRSLRTPPVIARSIIERAGYHESFPHLLGRVTTQAGSGMPAESDLVLLPAGCYCVYPLYADTRLTSATELSVEATCFRQEGSAEMGRLRSFRMREFVWIGPGEQCLSWRDRCLSAVRGWLTDLGLTTETAVASDPFFGAGSRLIRQLQIEQGLKIEILATVGKGQIQAVASGNYHKDQFGRLFAIFDHTGNITHSACLAFGYERLVLALIHRHGDDPNRWPGRVRDMLRLGALA
jgi:seryl-tRNA synthetase